MIGNHVRIVRLILEGVADIAVGPIERVGSHARGIKRTTIIFPGNILGAQNVADALLRRRRNDETGLYRSCRSEGRIDVDGLPILAWTTFRIHMIWQRIQGIRDRCNAGLRRVVTIEPLRPLLIEVKRAGLGVGIIDIGRRGRRGIAMTVAEEYLIGKTERLAVWARATQHRLVIVVAHRVFISEGFEDRRVAVLHVEEFHGLPGITRRTGGRRAVGRRNCRLRSCRQPVGLSFDTCSAVDGAIHLLDHLKVLMDRVAGVGVKWHRQPGQLERPRWEAGDAGYTRCQDLHCRAKPVPPVVKRN